MTTLETPSAAAVVRRARRAPVRRLRLVLGGLALALLGAFAARVLLGDFTVTIPDFVHILGGADIPGATYVVMEATLPRAVLAVLVGLTLGTAGAVFQTTLRNPLAAPDLLGVSLGASAAAVFAIVSLDQTGAAVSVAAVLGALVVATAVRLVAGPLAGSRLVVAGVGVAAGLWAVIQYLFTRADTYDAQLVLRWLTGSVSAADWPTIRLLTLLGLVLGAALLALARSLRLVELGDDLARGLGVGRRRADALLVAGVLLTAVAVAAAGPVAFVAFFSGPIARALNGGRTTLLGAALVGATAVVAADYVADYLLGGVNLPVGVVTGAVGAPFLLWLLTRRRSG